VGADVGDGEQDNRGFGGLLRRLRAEAGLTQEELAAAARLGTRSVSDLERGVSRTARPLTARRLAETLGLSGPERARFLTAARGEIAGESATSPGSRPAAESSTATRALPRDLVGFTGRAKELDWLMSRLASATERASPVIEICAIGGLAGIGKTTLAVHVAHQLAAAYPDGQFFLPLHGHTPGQRPANPGEALASLLLAAGVSARQIPPGLEPRAARWRDFLAGKKVLLVLDDAAGHEQVEPLLPGTSGCTVLVTSRRRLAALDGVAVLSLDFLTQDEAAVMLVRLAGRPGLQPGDPDVARLVRLCGFLPLAIGMLASQLTHHPAWTTADLVADLAAARDQLAILRAEDLSVAAALSLSYRDLTAGQRRLFRRLGLHPGPDIDAHATAALLGLNPATARGQLEAVYDHYLLTELGRGRYRMHDLVREHARVLAGADDPDANEAATDRLLDYYVETALAAGSRIGTRILNYICALPQASPPACAPALTKVSEAKMWMQAEDANLRAAAEQAARTGRTRHATLIPAAMAEFLYAQGRWQDGIALHQTAVAAARDGGDRASHVRALLPLVHLEVVIGDYASARANLNQAVTLARQLGDQSGEAESIVVLAMLDRLACDYPGAMGRYVEALAMFRHIGSARGAASALTGIGIVQLIIGIPDAAVTSHRQALDLCRAVGDSAGRAEVLVSLAAAEVHTGRYAQAASTLDQARAIAEGLEDGYMQAFVLNQIGVVQRLSGTPEAAVASNQAALQLFAALGLPHGEAMALNELGLALQLTGDFAAATASHEQALAVWRVWCDSLGQAEVLNSLGELALRRSASADSLLHHGQALALARDIGAPFEEARALEGMARCYLQDGHSVMGADLLQRSLGIYSRIGAAAAGGLREALAAVVLAC
jgi:tetratricopeptide (TPR) repeat protein/transcriptional regulator with XRE-family HTH domain